MTFIILVLAFLVAMFLFKMIGWLAPFLFIAVAVGLAMEHLNLSLIEVFQIVVLLIVAVMAIYAYVKKEKHPDQPVHHSDKDDKNAALWKD